MCKVLIAKAQNCLNLVYGSAQEKVTSPQKPKKTLVCHHISLSSGSSWVPQKLSFL